MWIRPTTASGETDLFVGRGPLPDFEYGAPPIEEVRRLILGAFVLLV